MVYCPINFGDCHECEHWKDNQYCDIEEEEPPEPLDNMRMRR